mgnify:CR=1 FL=1
MTKKCYSLWIVDEFWTLKGSINGAINWRGISYIMSGAPWVDRKIAKIGYISKNQFV